MYKLCICSKNKIIKLCKHKKFYKITLTFNYNEFLNIKISITDRINKGLGKRC